MTEAFVGKWWFCKNINNDVYIIKGGEKPGTKDNRYFIFDSNTSESFWAGLECNHWIVFRKNHLLFDIEELRNIIPRDYLNIGINEVEIYKNGNYSIIS